jgi:hypothetical protein
VLCKPDQSEVVKLEVVLIAERGAEEDVIV